MKNIYLSLLTLFCLLTGTASAIPYVLVSVAPHKFFVEKIGGDTIQVGLLVPAGASAHTYEPTPKQMLTASQAQLWFRIGEAFENRAIRALQSHHPQLKVIDMRQGLDLIGAEQGGCCCGHHGHEGMDLHFWLSARLAKTQAQTIATALTEAYPNHADLYQHNLKKFHNELDELDQQIRTILDPVKNRHILVSHPAYAYFCRDYHLHQFSIEFEGKDPMPQQLTKTLQLAREYQIKTIFIQPQYSNKGARLVADAIGADIVTLDPYSENYFKTMLEITQAFAKDPL